MHFKMELWRGIQQTLAQGLFLFKELQENLANSRCGIFSAIAFLYTRSYRSSEVGTCSTYGRWAINQVRPSVRIVIYVEDERFTSSRRFFSPPPPLVGGNWTLPLGKKIALFVSALRS